MDGLSMHVAVSELGCLEGAKIDRIQQPDPDVLVFSVRSSAGTKRLLLNSNAQNGRIHLTSRNFESPETPPAFCMLLRKRLVGGRIRDIRQHGLDRIVSIRISNRNDLSDETEYTLFTELMGKYSNVILVSSDGKVIDAIHRVPLGVSGTRAILPGLEYEVPSSRSKTDPFLLEDRDLLAMLRDAGDMPSFISSSFQGFSKATAERFTENCSTPEAVINRLRSIESGTSPVMILKSRTGEPVGVFPFSVLDGERCGSVSEAYDTFYSERDVLLHIQRSGSSLRKSIENILRRDHNKLAIYNAAIENEGSIESLRSYGDILMANLSSIGHGRDSVVLEDIYGIEGVFVRIPLDPSLSPVRNAEKYYKKYKKSRAARRYALEKTDSLSDEIDYLEGQLDCIGKCQTVSELDEIRDEMISLGFLKQKPGRKRRANLPPSRPMHYVSDDGIDIFVGKNNRQNDELTLRRASGGNLFFHAKDIPGSHVIVLSDGEAPIRTMEQACMLAAFYSKGRSSSSVPVDYTQRKYVKKPSGARPGKVVYTSQKTVYVTPEKRVVDAIRRVE